MTRLGALRRGYAIGRNIRLWLMVPLAFTLGLCTASPRVERIGPHVVGYGCEGAGGPLWASEEDHLPGPHCDRVERWQ